jgi:FtsP/CotA-like multicopper oxidase with cupredoxin domain
MYRYFQKRALPVAVMSALLGGSGPALAVVNVQCPGDVDGDAVIDFPDPNHPNATCMHLTAGDGFASMSDGNPLYTFGFADKTGVLPEDAIAEGILAARWPGSSIVLDEGDEFYLALTNVGTVIRPDLFDPHTVHWHGFPNAATVFDGVPEISIAINMGSTLTYYYNVVEPGTYMYHCHVEATEHMEMGMLANLYVRPAQNRLADGTVLGDWTHTNDDYQAALDACAGVVDDPATEIDDYAACVRNADDPLVGDKYVYNDGDGTTRYDAEAPLQVSSFDVNFHDASLFVQPLPFALLESNYPQINGRGYPDTIKDPADPYQDPATLVMGPPVDDEDGKVTGNPGEVLNNGEVAQDLGSLVTVNQGEKLLLRLSNVSVDRFFTIKAQGMKMKIVGTGARLMRGIDGKNIYQEVASFNFGGGEVKDILIDTADVAPGTYFLYATELHQMSNMTQLDGGMITEIVVN